MVQVSIGAQANHGLRLTIATTAMLIAFGAVVLSRLRAAAVDREGRLETETGLLRRVGRRGDRAARP